MSKSRSSSTAYAGDRTIKLAPLGCPFCGRELRAQDVELLDDGTRIVCPGCGRDLLMIEGQ
jgi:DNA-directed RNA polymerase subunit RPC12/RpoP